VSEPITPPITPAITTVTWKPSGPCIIEGPVVIRNNDGDILIPPPTKHPGQVKLCGCGRSANKPFCDGSHKR
jgi:CDGSH-type Zn-finger protein